jgi:hypothetical protein
MAAEAGKAWAGLFSSSRFGPGPFGSRENKPICRDQLGSIVIFEAGIKTRLCERFVNAK